MFLTARAKTKQKASNGPSREIIGIILIVVSLMLGYCVIVPQQSGAFGTALARIFGLLFGGTAFLFPVLLAWLGYVHLKAELKLHLRMDTIWSLLMLVCAASFMSLVGINFFQSNYGGWFGLHLSPVFRRLFGLNLSLVITAGIFIYTASLFFRISLRELFSGLWQNLVSDYEHWQAARRDLKPEAPQPPKIRERKPEQKTLDLPETRQAKPEIRPEIKNEPPRIVSPKSLNQPISVKPKPADSKAQVSAPAGTGVPAGYQLPPLDLLNFTKQGKSDGHADHLAKAELLTKTLADFDITARVIEIIPGPVVTRYDLELAPGIKVQAVTNISENLSLVMRTPSIRVVAVPEKSAVGIEVPNTNSSIVGLRDILSGPEFQNKHSRLALGLGKTTDGMPSVADLMPMPHLLIAGATGSGKSVGIHSIILSILYKARPDEVKFMLIDPKRLEMPTYRGLPHLYNPRVSYDKVDIITQPKDAADSLKKLTRVMEKRYEKFAKEAVRNIEGYNEKMAERGLPKEFYIVVIIDELADLMSVASKDIEDSIQRLAQMARAVGIHLILATQRPSVDVITGVIKANFPARIAFQTTSKVDSRVVLDIVGAEALLGRGDMLFLPPGESRPSRLQGAFVSVKEAEKVVKFILGQGVTPYYEDLFARPAGESKEFNIDDPDAKQEMADLVRALTLVQERKRVSQDLLKALFGSSAKATNVLSLLETKGFIHKPEGTNRWTIYFDKIDEYVKTYGPVVGVDDEM